MPQRTPGDPSDDVAADLVEERALHEVMRRRRPDPIETDEVVDAILRASFGNPGDGRPRRRCPGEAGPPDDGVL